MWLQNRTDAGQKLASLLRGYQQDDTVVLGIPRGGVVVAYEVAKALKVPLDILIVRKIGAPHNPEVAIGAVMPDGSAVLDQDMVNRLIVSESYINCVVKEQAAEIQRRESAYRGNQPAIDVSRKTVLLVDDGIATGYTIEAAVRGLRQYQPRAIIVAAPVAPPDTVERIGALADTVVCLDTPEPFYAVGQFYHDFTQTSDEEVIELLQAQHVMHK